MAVCAIQPRVPANQGEAVVVLLYGLKDDAPSLNRVTGLAVSSHLPPMNIGVAVGTACACVGEHHLGVALGATHAFV